MAEDPQLDQYILRKDTAAIAIGESFSGTSPWYSEQKNFLEVVGARSRNMRATGLPSEGPFFEEV